MADAPEVHIGENSPEEVAYKLLVCIAKYEKKTMYGPFIASADRTWLLDTYAECLETVKGHRLNSKGTTQWRSPPP